MRVKVVNPLSASFFLTGFYMRATLTLNGLPLIKSSKLHVLEKLKKVAYLVYAVYTLFFYKYPVYKQIALRT